jgi:hypothetical protein
MADVLKYYALVNNIKVQTPFVDEFPMTNKEIYKQSDDVLKARFEYANGLIYEVDISPIISFIRSNKKLKQMPDGSYQFEI